MPHASYRTTLGSVTARGPYFSFVKGREVIQLTFIKEENELNGYGVCKELPSDTPLTPDFMQAFAEASFDLL